MACETRLKPRQTVEQRRADVFKAIENINRALTTGRAKAVVGPQGAIAFLGITDEERDGVSDACAYRRIMNHGSGVAKANIARAEALAGRKVDGTALLQGIHSHDGKTWGRH